MDMNDRLDGWKEIASYLGRSVRTAHRWEKRLGLPVRRVEGQKADPKEGHRPPPSSIKADTESMN